MDINDRDNLKEFIVELYGPQARSWDMNEKVFKTVYGMVSASSACSDLMDYVPRPHALGKAPIKYLTKEIRSSIIRELKDRKRHYTICIKHVAANYRSHIQIQAMGI
jgi:hypothetical protein